MSETVANVKDWSLQDIRKSYPTFTRHFFKSGQKGQISAIRRAVKESWLEKVEDFKKAVVAGHLDINTKLLGKADKDFLQKLGFDLSESESDAS